MICTPNIGPSGYVVSDDLFVAKVHDSGQVDLSPVEGKFGDVGHEDLVRCIDSELSL